MENMSRLRSLDKMLTKNRTIF